MRKKTEPIISLIGYPTLKYVLIGPILKAIWMKDIVGLENVPSKGPCLIASNHESYFDFFIIAAALNRRISFLAAEKFYKNRVWKLINDCMGSIKVDRYASFSVSTYRCIKDEVKRDKIIGIFPEGTRSPDGKLLRGKPGVAHFAIKLGLPVVPVGLVGTYDILPKEKAIPNLSKAIVKFGEPVSYSHLQGIPLDQDELQDVTDDIMRKIATLTGEEYLY